MSRLTGAPEGVGNRLISLLHGLSDGLEKDRDQEDEDQNQITAMTVTLMVNSIANVGS